MQKALIPILLGALLLASVYLTQYQTPSLQLHSPVIFDETVEQYFGRWAAKHGKAYATEEERIYRLAIFAQNIEEIAAHNMRTDVTHTLAENQFADLSNEEWRATYLGYKKPVDGEARRKTVNRVTLPDPNQNYNISWVNSGALGNVLNQGQCGSCWAFSTAENLQAVNYLNKNPFVYYSEQQLVDCSTAYGNQGCNGGLMTQAFQYVVKYGIEPASAYPYKAVDGTCQYNSAEAQMVITAYTAIPENNCADLVTALQTQPIAIAVDAQTWQFYSRGILSLCGKTLDHGVQLVGYFEQTGQTGYYTVKNSWGASWGEQGYIQLATGNTCGLCQDASTGNLK